MSQFVIAACRRRSCGGSKGALYRETLQATGCYEGRVVIATAEFAPMPPSTFTGLPRRFHSDGHRLRFRRHGGIYRSDVVQGKTQEPNLGNGTEPPPAGQPRTQAKERAGRITPFSSSAMSSGRLFLDRVGRHQSPSLLHRHGQHNLIARPKETNYHRTGNSVLTVCLSSGGRCIPE
jgi:hypothetical protein